MCCNAFCYSGSLPNQLSKQHAKADQQLTLPSLGHVDVIERENDYQVHVDLPGVDLKDVELTIANGLLHVAAERKQVHEEKSEFSHSIERSYGRVQRSVPLPVNAQADTGDANLNNGVLTVQFAKRPPAEPSRKLEIKTAAAV